MDPLLPFPRSYPFINSSKHTYLLISFQDMIFRKMRFPNLICFSITLHSISFRTFEIRSISTMNSYSQFSQSGRIQTIHLSQEFPSKVDCSLLEVISEWPITKHLKECVMIHILAHIIEIVMLASRTNTFLRIACSSKLCQRTCWVNLRVRSDFAIEPVPKR